MYQPKTGAKCTCKRGVQRDNCSTCEGTGWVVDFAAIRALCSNLKKYKTCLEAMGLEVNLKTGTIKEK